MNYTINDADYPRVSTLLDTLAKPALVNWAANQVLDLMRGHVGKVITDEMIGAFQVGWRDASQDALDVGSAVHAHIEDNTPVGDDEPEAVRNAYRAWQAWRDATKPLMLAQEVVVYNPALGYAGRFDAIYRRADGRVCIADWKTSAAIYPEYRLQVALYVMALRLMPRDGLTHYRIGEVTGSQPALDVPDDLCGEIVRLDKVTGEFESVILDGEDLARQCEAAEHLVKFYYLHKQRRTKNAMSRRKATK